MMVDRPLHESNMSTKRAVRRGIVSLEIDMEESAAYGFDYEALSALLAPIKRALAYGSLTLMFLAAACTSAATPIAQRHDTLTPTPAIAATTPTDTPTTVTPPPPTGPKLAIYPTGSTSVERVEFRAFQRICQDFAGCESLDFRENHSLARLQEFDIILFSPMNYKVNRDFVWVSRDTIKKYVHTGGKLFVLSDGGILNHDWVPPGIEFKYQRYTSSQSNLILMVT